MDAQSLGVFLYSLDHNQDDESTRNRDRPVTRRFIKILIVNLDFLHGLMLRYIFHNFIQFGTLLYSCDDGAGLSGAPDESSGHGNNLAR